MSNIGCPYKERNIGTGNDYCPIIKKTVEGFVMCEVDWESCPEYHAQKNKEETRARLESEYMNLCYSEYSPAFECEALDCCECRKYLEYAFSAEELQLLGEK